MRDYKNDIERLRCCAELHGECSLCLYQGNPCDCMPETPIRDAADAIEELLAEREKYRHAAFVIGETCVDESKGHISPEDAIKKIRESIYYDNTASCYDALEEVV